MCGIGYAAAFITVSAFFRRSTSKETGLGYARHGHHRAVGTRGRVTSCAKRSSHEVFNSCFAARTRLQIIRIFDSILAPKLADFDVEVKPLAAHIAQATLRVSKLYRCTWICSTPVCRGGHDFSKESEKNRKSASVSSDLISRCRDRERERWTQRARHVACRVSAISGNANLPP